MLLLRYSESSLWASYTTFLLAVAVASPACEAAIVGPKMSTTVAVVPSRKSPS